MGENDARLRRDEMQPEGLMRCTLMRDDMQGRLADLDDMPSLWLG